MGCSSGGCSSGGCSTGSCNKKNVFDWFSNIQFASGIDEFNVVEISFKGGSRKDYYVNDKRLDLVKGEFVCVEGSGGYDIGQVSLKGELVKLQLKKNKVDINKEPLPKILRKANEKEMDIMETFRKKEMDAMIKARLIARQLNLEMKISEVEYQADGKKAIFYFIADERVDFRELIKRFVAEYKIKIELKHIGARQEAGRIGGMGSCGRELCCSTWLNDFPSVTTSAARYQNISINIEKLSGQCGRLKCCLNYELAQYVEATKEFPSNIHEIQTEEGVAIVRKTEILKRQLVFTYKNDPASEYYKLTLSDVKNIVEMNKRGQKPQSLSSMAVKEKEEEKVKKDEDLVGQIQLKTLEKKKQNTRKNKNKPKNNARSNSVQNNTADLTQGDNQQRTDKKANTNRPINESVNNQTPRPNNPNRKKKHHRKPPPKE
jgi:cell fate regulator YaaT (PSP1 superfamily)